MGNHSSSISKIAPFANETKLNDLLKRPSAKRIPSEPATEFEDIIYKRYHQQGGDASFKDGDILAFSGYKSQNVCINCFHSVEKETIKCPYTHMGIVVLLNVDGITRPFVLEATPNGERSRDAVQGDTSRKGLWIFHMLDRVFDSEAQLWHLPLKKPLSAQQIEELHAFLLEVYHLDPKYAMEQMLLSGLEKYCHLADNKFNIHEFFCSELVAACHKVTGLLRPSANVAEMTPGDVLRCSFIDYDAPQLKYKCESTKAMREEELSRCLLCCCVPYYFPNRFEHIHRNRFNINPTGDLIPVKDDPTGSIYIDSVTRQKWYRKPFMRSLFHMPCINYKLVSNRFTLEEMRDEPHQHGPGTITSSEFVVRKRNVRPDGVIPREWLITATYNYRDPRYAGCMGHWCADVLPCLCFCDCLPCGCGYDIYDTAPTIAPPPVVMAAAAPA